MNELSILDSLFNDVLGAATPSAVYGSVSPKVDVTEEENAYILEMDLPGKCEKDINIELDHDKLTISSKSEEKNKSEKSDKKTKFILKERRSGDFERRFTLPADVDGEKISANFKNGVLTVNMCKKAVELPKRIDILAC